MFFGKNFYPSFGSDSEILTSNRSRATTKPHVRRLKRDRRGSGLPIGNYTLAVLLASCVLVCALAGCGSNYTVTATGIGAFQASSNAVEFGNVQVGQTADSSVTLINQGTAAVSVSNLSISGNQFAIANPNSLPVMVAPNSTYSIDVQFKPKANGGSTGQLTVSSSSRKSPSLKIKLSGNGAAVSASAVLSSLSCGQNYPMGAGADECTVTLSSAATGSGVVVGLGSNNSAVGVPGSVTVPAGATSAGFTATVSAVTTAQSATLTATAGGVTKNYSIGLGPATPKLTLGTGSLSFGSVNLNTPATQSVTLTSSGTAPVTIGNGIVTGGGFSISGVSFPATLNPGQVATLYVQFDPTAVGTASGTVTLTTNASPSTATIGLGGTGQSVAYEVNLTWNAPTGTSVPVAGYNVYRATAGSTSFNLLNASVNVPASYTDTSVQSGASYTYYVATVDAKGNQSIPSNTYTAAIP